MAEKEDDLELGTPPAASKKKLIIILVVALLLLVGGGLAAWLLLSGETPETEGSEQEKSDIPSLSAQKDINYQELTPVFVANLSGHPRLLQVGLVLSFRYPGLVDFLKHNDPALRNGVLNLLSGQEGQALKSREGKEQLRLALKAEINKVIQRYRGPGEIDEVFYSSFIMQ